MLKGGEGIIWVEFTKVSKNPYWLQGAKHTARPSKLAKFPSEKVIDDPHDYLNKAGVMAAGGVQSAFKEALESARGAANAAKTAAEDARGSVNRVTNFAIFGVLGVAVGVGALMLSAYQLSFPIRDNVSGQADRIGELEERLQDMVEAQSNGPVVTPTQEAGTTNQEPASEATQPVEAAELPSEP